MLRSAASRRSSGTAAGGGGGEAARPAIGQHLLKKSPRRSDEEKSAPSAPGGGVPVALRRVEKALPGYHPSGPVDFADEAAVLRRLDEIDGVVDAWMRHLGIE